MQIVHYPLFALVGRERFSVYERAHQRRTTLVVAPIMLVELLTATWISLAPPEGIVPALPWAGLALVAMIWVSTALVQSPLHRRLIESFDPRAAAILVHTNWVRTFAWSVRTVLAAAMLRSGDPA